ncbi:HAMP domain-containing sensor histidine kinase [Nonomuraea dietziae]|uniref:HAMP domain-containing sensor histidine kinase n=1 Tax=Nonomuraea dietziae TaxID=65515 RepID=UPI00340F6413
MTLRIKLIAATLALLAFGFTFIGVLSVSVLHNYLIDRVDTQISVVATRALIRIQHKGSPGLKNLVLEPDAIIRAGGPWLSGLDADNRPRPVVPDPPPAVATTVPAVSGDGEWRMQLVRGPQSGSVLVAVDLDEVTQITRRLALIELLGGGGILLILAVVGVSAVRGSMRPLAEIERTAEAIAGGELGRRVPDGDPHTEVGRLARALNGMLAQIESAFAARTASENAASRSEERMRRFVADAAHELRTPLTTIKGFAEYARQNPDADPAEMLHRVERAAGRMSLLVDDLLLLARVDQQRPLQMRPVDMLALAADAVHDARILAPDRGISLEVVGGAALIVSGDEVRLRQVIGNLMSNALTHTPGDTPVTIRVGASGETAFLDVVDKGPGLTPEQAERVFERFYRADSARARRSEDDRGSGLGLAIVEALVRAHSGSVVVDSVPGEGSVFRVELPLAPE